jgi:hypothetical protein
MKSPPGTVGHAASAIRLAGLPALVSRACSGRGMRARTMSAGSRLRSSSQAFSYASSIMSRNSQIVRPFGTKVASVSSVRAVRHTLAVAM